VESPEVLERICAEMDRPTLLCSCLVSWAWKKCVYTHLWRRLDQSGFLSLLTTLASLEPLIVGLLSNRSVVPSSRYTAALPIYGRHQKCPQLDTIPQTSATGPGNRHLLNVGISRPSRGYPSTASVSCALSRSPHPDLVEALYREPDRQYARWDRQGRCAHALLVAAPLRSYTIHSFQVLYPPYPEDRVPCPPDLPFVHILPWSLCHLDLQAWSLTSPELSTILVGLPRLRTLTVGNRDVCDVRVLRLLATHRPQFQEIITLGMKRHPVFIPVPDHQIPVGSSFRTLTFGDTSRDANSFASEPVFPPRLAALVVDLLSCPRHDEHALFTLIRTVAEKNPDLKKLHIHVQRSSNARTDIFEQVLTSSYARSLTHVHVHTALPVNFGSDGSVVRSIARSLPNAQVIELETYGYGSSAPLDVLVHCPLLFYLALNLDTSEAAALDTDELPSSSSLSVLITYAARLRSMDAHHVAKFLLAVQPRGVRLSPEANGRSYQQGSNWRGVEIAVRPEFFNNAK
jgi:hypothetical protein